MAIATIVAIGIVTLTNASNSMSSASSAESDEAPSQETDAASKPTDDAAAPEADAEANLEQRLSSLEERMNGIETLLRKLVESRQVEAAEESESAPAVPKRAPSSAKRLIDLTKYYNGSLTEGWLPSSIAGNTSDKTLPIPRGIQTLGGTKFDVRGLIQLTGEQLEAAGGNSPKKVTGIKVGLQCDRLAFLHAAAWGASQYVEKGTEIARLVVQYRDGSHAEIPIVTGQNVGDWVAWDETDYPNAERVWEGKNHAGLPVRVFKSDWENPHPNKTIESIDYVSTRTDAAPFLVAITALQGADR